MWRSIHFGNNYYLSELYLDLNVSLTCYEVYINLVNMYWLKYLMSIMYALYTLYSGGRDRTVLVWNMYDYTRKYTVAVNEVNWYFSFCCTIFHKIYFLILNCILEKYFECDGLLLLLQALWIIIWILCTSRILSKDLDKHFCSILAGSCRLDYKNFKWCCCQWGSIVYFYWKCCKKSVHIENASKVYLFCLEHWIDDPIAEW